MKGTRSVDECKIRPLDFSESGGGSTVELGENGLSVVSHDRLKPILPTFHTKTITKF